MEPDAVEAVTDVRAAAEVLRPALLLWLVVVGMFGATSQVLNYLPLGLRAGSLVPLVIDDAGYLATAVVIAAFARRDRTACCVWSPPRRGMVWLCLLVGIAGSLLLAMWERTIVPWYHPSSPAAFDMGIKWPLWGTLWMSAVMPAVFEEVMYRGVILQRSRAVVSVPLAIAVQAMMFAVTHMDRCAVLPHFVFGCLAGLLRTMARALWPCMLMHFLWNGWIVLEQYGWL